LCTNHKIENSCYMICAHPLVIVGCACSFHCVGWAVSSFSGVKGFYKLCAIGQLFKKQHKFIGWSFKNMCILHGGKPKMKGYALLTCTFIAIMNIRVVVGAINAQAWDKVTT
jgi:hypothetical protein